MPEILDKINELRELFRERYGVEVRVEINTFPTLNPHITPELANYISHELAAMAGPEQIKAYYSSQSDSGDHRWTNLETRAGFNFVGHY